MSEEEKIDDLKRSIIYIVQNSKATDSVSLFSELLTLLWTMGFKEGQNYIKDRADDGY